MFHRLRKLPWHSVVNGVLLGGLSSGAFMFIEDNPTGAGLVGAGVAAAGGAIVFGISGARQRSRERASVELSRSPRALARARKSEPVPARIDAVETTQHSETRDDTLISMVVRVEAADGPFEAVASKTVPTSDVQRYVDATSTRVHVSPDYEHTVVLSGDPHAYASDPEPARPDVVPPDHRARGDGAPMSKVSKQLSIAAFCVALVVGGATAAAALPDPFSLDATSSTSHGAPSPVIVDAADTPIDTIVENLRQQAESTAPGSTAKVQSLVVDQHDPKRRSVALTVFDVSTGQDLTFGYTDDDGQYGGPASYPDPGNGGEAGFPAAAVSTSYDMLSQNVAAVVGEQTVRSFELARDPDSGDLLFSFKTPLGVAGSNAPKETVEAKPDGTIAPIYDEHDSATMYGLAYKLVTDAGVDPSSRALSRLVIQSPAADTSPVFASEVQSSGGIAIYLDTAGYAGNAITIVQRSGHFPVVIDSGAPGTTAASELFSLDQVNGNLVQQTLAAQAGAIGATDADKSAFAIDAQAEFPYYDRVVVYVGLAGQIGKYELSGQFLGSGW